MSPTSADPPRQPARRPPFTVALVAAVSLLLLLTALAIGGVSYRQGRRSAETLVDLAMAQAAAQTVAHAGEFMRQAEAAAALGPELASRGLVDPASDTSLEAYTLSVLRAHPGLTWVSYGGRDERFVGAWRDGAGRVFLNRSGPRDGRIHLEEVEILADGRRRPVRTSADHGYYPSQRPYFQLAAAARRSIWTEPYGFYGQGLGITCAAPFVAADGSVPGVFTVDFSFDRLSAFLDGLRIARHGKAFLLTAAGSLAAAPQATAQERRLAEAAAAGQGEAAAAAGFRSKTADFAVGGQRWRVAVVVPEADFLDGVHAQAREALVLGLVALLIAVLVGVAQARFIARPLLELTRKAEAIGAGDLEVDIPVRSRDEIGTLAKTLAGMLQGLRDRDFIRDVLGRYVSPELAAQALVDRGSLRLGGELRTVTIVMSDLRGFSGLSEQLGPEAMLQLLNRYFACMTPVVLAHRGTVNEFIGDAMLVLFGAPFQQPDDAERAVRCAAAMQRALVAFNAESRGLGVPEVAMGIAVHTGQVVAGNIGSEERAKYGVVGPAVNLTSRIESLTLGGQVLLSAATVARVAAQVEVGPARSVTLKGAAGPVQVHELRAIDGVPLPAGPAGGLVAVDLPVACHEVDGKTVADAPLAGRVQRIGLQELVVQGPMLGADRDVLVRIAFPGPAGPGSYAKVVGTDAAGMRLAFTALHDTDRRCIEQLLTRT